MSFLFKEATNDTKGKSRSFVCLFSFPLTLEKGPFLRKQKIPFWMVNASLDMMTIDKSDNSNRMVTFTGLTKNVSQSILQLIDIFAKMVILNVSRIFKGLLKNFILSTYYQMQIGQISMAQFTKRIE